jgi:2-polyprenyl-6-methoxyphenol hydroxylase-like FAD-dependent oxidoreductase
MAIESSFVLARCLSREGDLAGVLRRYETERMPRAAWITDQSWKMGRIGQLENPLACKARDFVLSIAPTGVTRRILERAAGFEL